MAEDTSPEKVAVAFIEAWNRHDADALAELFVPDADFVNVVGLWWRDREKIRIAHDYGFQRIFSNSHMTLRRVAVRHLGADVAVVHGAWTLRGQNSHGEREAGERRGVISFTVQRQSDGEWLAVSAQNTDRINGAETHIATEGSLGAAHYGHTPES